MNRHQRSAGFRARQGAKNESLIEGSGLNYEVKNDGYHYIVRLDDTVVDFYPTTGTWISRKGVRGDGFKSMQEFFLNNTTR